MNREITQQNLYLLLPGKINSLSKMIVKNQGISFFEAIDLIYKSKTYTLLEHENTKYWTMGPVALYESFMAEKLREHGNF